MVNFWVRLFWVFLVSSLSLAHAEKPDLLQQELSQWPAGSLLLVDAKQQSLSSYQADKLLIPASTTKLVTAYFALQHWGASHRFKTDFYVIKTTRENPVLWVKGYGDPFLVSEELEWISQNLSLQLKLLGIEKLSAIYLDESFLEKSVVLPGTGKSDNPYDAMPAALAANFNTVNVKRQAGQWVSAESQTPLTSLAKHLAIQRGEQKETRFNLGTDEALAGKSFAQLLAALLRQQGVEVGQSIVHQKIAAEQTTSPLLFYRHLNRKTLAEMIKLMMRYSTNFIANQLALKMSADVYGLPANADKVKQFLNSRLSNILSGEGYFLEDGAGLSRENRLTARQLVTVLENFKPWRHLLPEVTDSVYAKSGTLVGVHTLAGYVHQQNAWFPFALMLNDKVPYRYRNKIAGMLKQSVSSP